MILLIFLAIEVSILLNTSIEVSILLKTFSAIEALILSNILSKLKSNYLLLSSKTFSAIKTLFIEV